MLGRGAALLLASCVLSSCDEPVPDVPVPEAPTCVELDATAAPVGDAPASEDSLAALVDSGSIGGAAVGVASGDATVWLSAHGHADAARTRAVTVDTPFLLASVTKVFVATLVMQLVEDGLVDLDTDVGAQAPVLSVVRHPGHPDTAITPRMLLTHTSALWDVPFTFDATWATSGDASTPMRDFVVGYFAESGPYAGGADMWWPDEPGSFSCYSNMGFGVLGVLVEEVSGLPLEELAQRRIFEPLGMTHTSFRADAFCDDVLVRGVRPDGARLVDDNLGAGPQPEGHPELASGMLKSSAPDLLRFAAAIAQGGVGGSGVRILDDATVVAMLARQLPADIAVCGDGRSDPAEQALGFARFPDAGGNDWAGHYGGMNGAATALWFIPSTPNDEAISFAALVNSLDLDALGTAETAVLDVVRTVKE